MECYDLLRAVGDSCVRSGTRERNAGNDWLRGVSERHAGGEQGGCGVRVYGKIKVYVYVCVSFEGTSAITTSWAVVQS